MNPCVPLSTLLADPARIASLLEQIDLARGLVAHAEQALIAYLADPTAPEEEAIDAPAAPVALPPTAPPTPGDTAPEASAPPAQKRRARAKGASATAPTAKAPHRRPNELVPPPAELGGGWVLFKDAAQRLGTNPVKLSCWCRANGVETWVARPGTSLPRWVRWEQVEGFSAPPPPPPPVAAPAPEVMADPLARVAAAKAAGDPIWRLRGEMPLRRKLLGTSRSGVVRYEYCASDKAEAGELAVTLTYNPSRREWIGPASDGGTGVWARVQDTDEGVSIPSNTGAQCSRVGAVR